MCSKTKPRTLVPVSTFSCCEKEADGPGDPSYAFLRWLLTHWLWAPSSDIGIVERVVDVVAAGMIIDSIDNQKRVEGTDDAVVIGIQAQNRVICTVAQSMHIEVIDHQQCIQGSDHSIVARIEPRIRRGRAGEAGSCAT